MGCVNSKKVVARTASPAGTYIQSSSRKKSNGSGRSTVVEPPITSSSSRGHSGVVVTHTHKVDPKPEEWKKGSLSMDIGLSHRFVDAEQNAAGWPSWLTSVAGESIHGWVPLKTDSFEKLDKVCSSLFSILIQSLMFNVCLCCFRI